MLRQVVYVSGLQHPTPSRSHRLADPLVSGFLRMRKAFGLNLSYHHPVAVAHSLADELERDLLTAHQPS